MAKQVSRILSTAFFLAWAVVPALGQGLSAKVGSVQPQPAAVSTESDRMRDGLVGPVRRVRTELVKVSNAGGTVAEERKHTLIETAEYDVKGNKTQNQYFPIAGSALTGREVYKYDDKGNISEMTLLAPDGSLIGKELYKYEFDSVGNWTRMTTSVAVVGNGQINFEATEVTYRTIFYYLDEKMARMLEPAPSPAENTPRVENKAAVSDSPRPNITNNRVDNPKPAEKSRSVAANKPSADAPSFTSLDKSKISLNQPVPPEARSMDTRQAVVLDAEPPPSAEPKPILKPVSRGVLNGAASHLPPPAYPEIARRMRAAGVVVVEVVIDETGKVISSKAVSGPSVLRDVAEQAALRARFTPTKLSGQPVKITGTINYNFTLAP